MKLPRILSKLHSKNSSARLGIVHQVARDPYIDWVIIFSFSFTVAVLLVVVGVYTYIDLNKQLDSSTKAGTKAATAIIDTKQLSKALDQFDSRATEHDGLLKSYSGSTDPSI